MSVRVMSSVFEHSQATESRRLVLLALADYSDDDGYCWPSMLQIAKKARISERQARYSVRHLQKMGEVSAEIGCGRGHRNAYQITVGPLANKGGNGCPFSGNDKGGNQRHRKGAISDTERGQSATATYKEEPSIESSEEPSEHSCASQTDARPPAAEPENHEPHPNDYEGNGDGNRTGTAEPVDFEGFWQAYPRKVGKKPASAAYKRCRNRHGSTTILQGLGRWLAYWDDPQFIPYPATFLNREHYLEEPPARRAKGVAGALEEYLSS